MAFLIVSEDGCLKLCTASAVRAAAHLKALEEAGVSAAACCINGKAYTIAALEAYYVAPLLPV